MVGLLVPSQPSFPLPEIPSPLTWICLIHHLLRCCLRRSEEIYGLRHVLEPLFTWWSQTPHSKWLLPAPPWFLCGPDGFCYPTARCPLSLPALGPASWHLHEAWRDAGGECRAGVLGVPSCSSAVGPSVVCCNLLSSRCGGREGAVPISRSLAALAGWRPSDWWALRPAACLRAARCCVALGSICSSPPAPEERCESPDNQNMLPTGSTALKSGLMKGSLSCLGICLSHRTLLCLAGRKPGDECGRDNEAPMARCWVADYHINVRRPNWMLGKGQYIFNWKYKGLLMARLELGGFMSLPLDGIEGNGMIQWAACTSPDLLPIIYIPLKSISAEGHSRPEFFHVKSFLSQTQARQDAWQLKLFLRLLILILRLGEMFFFLKTKFVCLLMESVHVINSADATNGCFPSINSACIFVMRLNFLCSGSERLLLLAVPDSCICLVLWIKI